MAKKKRAINEDKRVTIRELEKSGELFPGEEIRIYTNSQLMAKGGIQDQKIQNYKNRGQAYRYQGESWLSFEIGQSRRYVSDTMGIPAPKLRGENEEEISEETDQKTEGKGSKMASSKKRDFTNNNPALAFFSQSEEPGTEPEKKSSSAPRKPARTPAPDSSPAPAPEGATTNGKGEETKSQRVQLLLQPSLVSAIREYAESQSLSMNEAISRAIREYLERR